MNIHIIKRQLQPKQAELPAYLFLYNYEKKKQMAEFDKDLRKRSAIARIPATRKQRLFALY